MQYSSAKTPKPKVAEVTPATLIQRSKNLFTQEVLEASPFAKELYKIVRNKVKKLDDILRIEDRVKDVKGDITKVITEEQADKLKNKDSYMQSVSQSLEAFEIYKNSEFASVQSSKNLPPTQDEKQQPNIAKEEEKESKPSFSTQTQTQGGVENKVVECSILQQQAPVQTQQKQTQATPVYEPVQQLVKEKPAQPSVNIEEALKVISPIILILPHLMSLMGPNQNLITVSKMTIQEAQLLIQLYLSTSMASHYQESIDERIKRTVAELAKIAQGNNDSEKLSFNSQISYGDLKKILYDRFLNNKEFLAMKATQLTQMNFPLIPAAGLAAQAGTSLNFGIMPPAFPIAQTQIQVPSQFIQQPVQIPQQQVTASQRNWHEEDNEQEEDNEKEIGVNHSSHHHSHQHHEDQHHHQHREDHHHHQHEDHHHHHHEEHHHEQDEDLEEVVEEVHPGSGEQLEKDTTLIQLQDNKPAEDQQEDKSPSGEVPGDSGADNEDSYRKPFEQRTYDSTFRGGYRGQNRGGYRGNYRENQEGGYRGRGNQEGGYRGRGNYEGGYRGRDNQEVGYRGRDSQDGGYRGRDSQEGGYRGRDNQDGGYRGRDSQDGGYRGRGLQEGGYRGRGNHEGGYRGRGSNQEGGEFRGRPFRGKWENRGGYQQDTQGLAVESAEQDPNNQFSVNRGGARGGDRGSYRGYSSRGSNHYMNKERTEGGADETPCENQAQEGENSFNPTEGGEDYRGGYRGRGGRGGYRNHFQKDYEGGQNPFYRNNGNEGEGLEESKVEDRPQRKFFNEGAPRTFKPHYKNYDNNQDEGSHQYHHTNNHQYGGFKHQQQMATDGFEVVKKRGDQQQHSGPTPFNEGRGPRIARGAQDIQRGQSRGGYRGERRHYQDLGAVSGSHRQTGASEPHQDTSE